MKASPSSLGGLEGEQNGRQHYTNASSGQMIVSPLDCEIRVDSKEMQQIFRLRRDPLLKICERGLRATHMHRKF